MARYKTKLTPKTEKRKSPIWLFVTGFGLILVAAWAVFSLVGRVKGNIEVTGAPSIKVESEVLNYGDVALGEVPIRTNVKVTNVGDKPLRFTEAPYIEVMEGC